MMPQAAGKQTIYRKDYRPPAFAVDDIDLLFDLGEDETLVTARLSIRRREGGEEPCAPLRLDGIGLDLRCLSLDGKALAATAYSLDDKGLSIADVPDSFVLETTVAIRPRENTLLEGLYTSGGNFCTQCEAEGFRRITFFPDRPDVLSRYRVEIRADRERYPVLLSNGNPDGAGDLEAGRHYARWRDPFPKPCYLFALVAGDLDYIEDRHTTPSGRSVQLRIYAAGDDIGRCGFAMESLKKAMAWDERVFGLECDLDYYNIVAVGDFNAGAMENKGLNIFNTKLVLADPQTATDDDFARVESVIGHEYFHNWTGNRVTCRDWFQLSLKEGLTVFRDQQFSVDVSGSPVKRIEDVRLLRAHQFLEDAGPMAHSVRPDSYMEVSNFYTGTVYEKGAEVIRMIHAMLGVGGFRKGMDLYFRRHDGAAVTCEDFVAAMEDANGADLGQFRLWYAQAGTPEVDIARHFDAESKTLTLSLRQLLPPTAGQPDKKPLHIPLKIGLLDGASGDDAGPLTVGPGIEAVDGGYVLSLTGATQNFTFSGLGRSPVPSLSRGFSAPVKVKSDLSDDELAFLMAHDSDPFARWEAGQSLALRLLLELVGSPPEAPLPAMAESFARAIGQIIDDQAMEPAFKAEMLTLPGESYVAQAMPVIDVDGIHRASERLAEMLAKRFGDQWEALYRRLSDNQPWRFEARAAGRRRLRNRVLACLVRRGGDADAALAFGQFQGADNMTDSLGSLRALAGSDFPERLEALDLFHRRWRDNPLVLDKWYSVQALSRRPDTLDVVRDLTAGDGFDLTNPNRVRALIGAFASANQVRFHAADGSGYRFLAERIMAIQKVNSRTAARLLAALERWRRFDPARGALMKQQIERILGQPNVPGDVYEIASKAVADQG